MIDQGESVALWLIPLALLVGALFWILLRMVEDWESAASALQDDLDPEKERDQKTSLTERTPSKRRNSAPAPAAQDSDRRLAVNGKARSVIRMYDLPHPPHRHISNVRQREGTS